MIFHYIEEPSPENISGIKFITASLLSLSRRIKAEEIYFFSEPYLQVHRERTMAALIIFTMNSEKCGSRGEIFTKTITHISIC